MTIVTSIVYKPESGLSEPENRYARIPLDSANLIAGRGIEGDRKGGNPKRNLNIMSYETLEALHEEGFRTQPGQMGEQIVIQGLEVGKLSAGDRLARAKPHAAGGRLVGHVQEIHRQTQGRVR